MFSLMQSQRRQSAKAVVWLPELVDNLVYIGFSIRSLGLLNEYGTLV